MRAEATERGAHRLIGAGFEFSLVTGRGFPRLAHHRRIDQECTAIDESPRRRRRAAARPRLAAFACRESYVHPQVAAKRLSLGIVPGERSSKKREKSLAETGDGFGFRLPRKARAGRMRQRALDARGNQEKRFALDRREQFGLVFGFARDAQPPEIERIALHESRGALLFQHEPDNGAGHRGGASG